MFGTSASAFVSPQRFPGPPFFNESESEIISLWNLTAYASCLCQVAALARCHMNGSIPLDRTIQKTTETMPLAPNQKPADTR